MDGETDSRRITLYSPEAFAGMRLAGRLAAEALDMIAEHVVPGVTTESSEHALPRLHRGARRRPGAAELSRLSRSRSAPRSTTSSATASRATGRCEDGDIVNIDVTVILDGWHGDTSRMYVAGTSRPTRASG